MSRRAFPAVMNWIHLSFFKRHWKKKHKFEKNPKKIPSVGARNHSDHSIQQAGRRETNRNPQNRTCGSQTEIENQVFFPLKKKSLFIHSHVHPCPELLHPFIVFTTVAAEVRVKGNVWQFHQRRTFHSFSPLTAGCSQGKWWKWKQIQKIRKEIIPPHYIPTLTGALWTPVSTFCLAGMAATQQWPNHCAGFIQCDFGSPKRKYMIVII